MRRFLATVVIAAIGTTLASVGIALATEIEVSPSSPPAGPAELTIDVTDFDPNTAIYAVPCAIPAAGEDLDVSTASCDVAEVATAVTDALGAASIVVSWTIPVEGIAVYVSDEARAKEATRIVTPDAADDEIEIPAVAVLGTSVVQEDLAETGPREARILLMVAAVAIGLGVVLREFERFRTTA